MSTASPWLTVLLLVVAGCSSADGPALGGSREDGAARLREIRAAMEKLRPLHTKLGPPRPGDWLDQHDEPGQTFEEYVRTDPIRATAGRRTLYIQPLGDFTREQREIVTLTADFMGRYFGLPVTVKGDLPLSLVPKDARRVHPSWGMPQILSTYVLDGILYPRLPKDAVAYLALTASDLWPGRGWNFVFGQASLRRRVGVWSIYRNGDPAAGPAERRLCLLRTIKTATHETGHMLSMHHCTAYECNMCGSNHRAESDRRPLALCPECVAKLWYATGAGPLKRYRSLAEFCAAQELEPERQLYAKSIEALTSK